MSRSNPGTLLQCHPVTQQTLAKHNQARLPCVFCGGLSHTPLMYFDTAQLVHTQLFIVTYNVCQRGVGRSALPDMVAAAYARDVSKARTQLLRRQRAWLT